MKFKYGIIFCIIIVILFAVSSFAQEKTEEYKVRVLVSQLYQNPWYGAEIVGESPTDWEFSLTEPMTKILEIGNPAQDILLEYVNDADIKDQIMFLLGGVGDEKAVERIIKAMIPKSKLSRTPNAKKINRSANVALTNITVADVIWHHGGGIVVENCRDNAKECWEKWWKKNKKSFSVKDITQSRRYSNYPNYGIYKNKN